MADVAPGTAEQPWPRVNITTMICVVSGTLQEVLFSQDLRDLSGKKEESGQHLAPYGVFFFLFFFFF